MNIKKVRINFYTKLRLGNYKLFPVLIMASLFLTNCLGEVRTFDAEYKIASLGTPLKLEYYKHKEGAGFQWDDRAAFVITDAKELDHCIEELTNADHPQPWKGAGWNRILIHYRDTILKINTNDIKIGWSANGQFYSLNRENFITKRLRN